MSLEILPSGIHLEIDFDNETEGDLLDEIEATDFTPIAAMHVDIPLPSFGSSNSYLDLCADLIDASWAVEQLAAHAEGLQILAGSNGIRAGVVKPTPAIKQVLLDCALVFAGYDLSAEMQEQCDGVRARINEYEDDFYATPHKVPEIADWYLGNLVLAANHEWKSEGPDYYRWQMSQFPERQIDFFRSTYSHLLGGACYASRDGWMLEDGVSLDHYFAATGQNYRHDDFLPCEVFSAEGVMLVAAEGMVARFPHHQFLRSQLCAALVDADPDDLDENVFDLLLRSFTAVPGTPERMPHELTDPEPVCLVHKTGTLVLVRHDGYQHLLYETAPLNAAAARLAHTAAARRIGALADAAGIAAAPALNWSTLTDEDFERLCYDVICAHAMFDGATVRKMGNSRSRDGGRDIEAFEKPKRAHEAPRKWIFQCKLVTKEKSLGASKVQDIGDVLEQYGAQGYGVMSSVLIDPTLYDRLDSICSKRGVVQLHMSVLELEREIAGNPSVRDKYFPAQT